MLRRVLHNVPLVIALRLTLGLLFVAAAIGKLSDPGKFAHSIYNFKVLDPSVVNLVAIYLPWVELLSGLALITGVLTRGAAFNVCAMLSMFLFALIFNWVRGRDIECGCFGNTRPPDIPGIRELLDFFLLSPKMTVTIWRDVVMLVMAIVVLHAPVVWRRQMQDRW